MITGRFTYRGLGQTGTAVYSSGAAASCTTDETGLETCTPAGVDYGTSTITFDQGAGAIAAAGITPAGVGPQYTPQPIPANARPGNPAANSCAQLLGNSPAATWVCNNLLVTALGAGVLLLLLTGRRRR